MVKHIRWLIVLALLALIVPSVLAGSYTWVDTLDGSDPTYNRTFGDCSLLSGTGTNVYYETLNFSVDTTGVYDLHITSFSGSDTTMTLYAGSFSPASATANCVEYDDDGGSGLLSRITRTLDAGVNYVLVASTFSNSDTGTFTLEMTGPGDICVGNCGGAGATGIGDGRINNKDAGPVVVFPDNAGGLHLYLPNGLLVLTVSAAEFDAVGVPSGENAFVKMDESIGLYVLRLTTGEYQVNMFMPEGKTYTLIFAAPYAGSPYSSIESQ
ncbi:MAG: hypothetical protein KC615_12830 [Anaerolineae bacterium]|nr:hypothetical protein [Anaerolineae bacterium]MCA9893862.1 hypothetical protein [Anaerolineae bacterium]